MPNTSLPIHAQPTTFNVMNIPGVSQTDEKRLGQLEHSQRCQQCQASSIWSARRNCEEHDCLRVQQSRCHGSRLRRVLVPTLAVVLTISLIIAFSCISTSDALSWGVDGLARRGTGDATGSTGGTFVNNKLYLIIIFVGLFLVIVLGIMLSAWCCRGTFENPLCCPCYLCACCGGLACLECIGCGLCAEGAEQM